MAAEDARQISSNENLPNKFPAVKLVGCSPFAVAEALGLNQALCVHHRDSHCWDIVLTTNLS